MRMIREIAQYVWYFMIGTVVLTLGLFVKLLQYIVDAGYQTTVEYNKRKYDQRRG